MEKNFTRARLRFLMRVSIIYLVLLTTCFQLANAVAVTGQNIEKAQVTFDLKDVSLKAVLDEIKEQTSILFVYPPELIESHSHVTVSVQRESVANVLENVIEKTVLGYREVDGNVVIYKISNVQNASGVAVEKKQSYTLRGTVVESKTGFPIPGVSIIIRNTINGTTTDADGKYSMDVNNGDVLVFSSIGYSGMEVSVDNRTLIDVKMTEDATTLGGVEIVGNNYWSTPKDMSIANITKVEAKEIENQPVTSPLMSLQGRVAGLDITPYNGVAGSAVKVQIRGNNSLRANGSYPLYVIDGVPIDSSPLTSASVSVLANGFDPLSTINPANIESIEVLKDGAATAIYGSRGANGVIVVKTKSASKTGKTNVDVSVYSGFGKMSNRLDLLNTREYLEMRREAFLNDNQSTEWATELVQWDTTRYTDWQDEMLGGTASVLDAQLGISGGNQNTQFSFSGGYHKEGVIFPGDFGYSLLSGRLNLNHASSDQRFRISFSANYGGNSNKQFDDVNYLSSILTLPPNSPALRNSEGELNWELAESSGYIYNTWINPLSYLLNTHQANFNNLVVNSNFSYEVIPHLFIKSNFGITELNGRELIQKPIAANSPTAIGEYTFGYARFGNSSRKTWIVEPQVEYRRVLDKHNFNFLVGSAFQGSKNFNRIDGGSGYTSDVLLRSFQAAPTKTIITDEENQYKYIAFFSRIGYVYDSKYMVDLTGRRDGSSRYGPGNQFGNFGSIGVGWILSNEGFLKQSNLISFAKIRGSYAITGNDQIGDYRYLNSYKIAIYDYQNTVSLYPNALYNPNFKWEQTQKTEIALELRILKDRLGVEAAWYRNRSSNQLVDYKLPATTGFPSVFANFDATIENSGYEIVVSSRNMDLDNFQWSTFFNISLPTNKLVSFPGIEKSPYSKIYRVGEPLSVRNLYTWTGVSPETGEHTFLDVNGNEEMDEGDKTLMNPTDPKYYGGISNVVTYKNIELSFLFQFYSRYSERYLPGLPGYGYMNQTVDVLDRWQKIGDVTSVARFSQDYDKYTKYSLGLMRSNYNTENTSFLRLKTISLTYSVPSRLLQGAWISSARIFIQGQNILTFTKSRSLDPETGTSLPPLRMISLGVQCKI